MLGMWNTNAGKGKDTQGPGWLHVKPYILED